MKHIKKLTRFLLRIILKNNHKKVEEVIFMIRNIHLIFYVILFKRCFFFMPARQYIAIFIVNKIIKFFKDNEINYYLHDGLLLGALRQESFAGGPSDIDLAVLLSDKKKIIKKIKKLMIFFGKNNFTESIHGGKKKFKFRENHLYFRVRNFLIDIYFIKKLNFKSHMFYYVDINKENTNKSRFLLSRDIISFSRTKKCYGKFDYFVPKRAEKYLFRIFGQNWKKPNKKQYMFKK